MCLELKSVIPLFLDMNGVLLLVLRGFVILELSADSQVSCDICRFVFPLTGVILATIFCDHKPLGPNDVICHQSHEYAQ